jgi:hypothetical protein
MVVKIKCACGCGQKISPKDNYGRFHYFVSGHNRRGERSGKYVTCLVCHKKLYRCSSQIKKYVTCSKKCFSKIVHLWAKGTNNYHWKGYFKHGTNSAYKGLRIHGHPMADKHGRILEHRFVVSCTIGRLLRKDEIVHHINNNPLDNRPENLMILSQAEHMRIHKRTAHPTPFPSKLSGTKRNS